MNWAHWKTIFWLRWRLMVNQIRRLSLINRLLAWAVLIVGIVCAISGFFGALNLGLWLLPATPPYWLAYVWCGLTGVYLLTHLTGLITELQRSESLSLEKFLHLPVSTRGIFWLNYLGSTINLSTTTFLPMMLGFATAMIFRYNLLMSLLIPLVLAFFLMVTSLSHQFRGWIASLMIDKRRKRNLMALGTGLLVVSSFIPFFIDRTFNRNEPQSSRQSYRIKQEALKFQFEEGKISKGEFEQRAALLTSERLAVRRQKLQRLENWARFGTAVVPVGWLAYGTDGLCRGDWITPTTCLFGMLAISVLSLSRSYATTLRIYRGEIGNQSARIPSRAAATAEIDFSRNEKSRPWMTKSFPFLTEHQSAIAMATLRGLSRAPEAKLAIFFPLVALAILGGSSIVGERWQVGNDYRGLSGVGICFFVMMGVSQLIQNQFGFDREGFRVFMLAPVREKDVLIGKNAALAPLALALAATALVAIQIFSPMKTTHFLATFFQLGTMYMVACLVGNLMSIYVPLAVKAGSMKPTNLNFGAAIMQILIFLFAPLGMAPAIAPLGLELVLANVFDIRGIPVYLLGAITYFLIMIILYRWIVDWEGSMLAERKWKILETIVHVGN